MPSPCALAVLLAVCAPLVTSKHPTLDYSSISARIKSSMTDGPEVGATKTKPQKVLGLMPRAAPPPYVSPFRCSCVAPITIITVHEEQPYGKRTAV